MGICMFVSIVIIIYFITLIVTERLLNNLEYASNLDSNNTSVNNSQINCPNITFKTEVYEKYDNGSVYYIKRDNKSLIYNLENNITKLCNFDINKDDVPYKIDLLSCQPAIGVLLAAFALFIQISVFTFVENVRSYGTCSVAIITMCTIVLTITLAFLNLDTVAEDQNMLYTIPTITHFYLLASFLWLSITSSEIFLLPPDEKSELESWWVTPSRTYYKIRNVFCLFFGISQICVSILIRFPSQHSPESRNFCWLVMTEPNVILFYGQVQVMFIMNMGLFYMNKVHEKAQNIRMRNNDNSPSRPDSLIASTRVNHDMYATIAFILISTWCIGTLATVPYLRWFYGVFVFLHMLETCGLIIWLYFLLRFEVTTNDIMFYFCTYDITRSLSNLNDHPAHDRIGLCNN